MLKKHFVLFTLLLILLAGVTLAWYLTRPKPVAVTVTEVGKGVVEATVSNTRAGSVKACRRARLSPSIGGQIAHLLVAEGAKVQQGTLLLELWNDDLKAQLDHARKSAAAARSKTNAICLRAQEAQRKLTRLAPLFERGAVAEDQLDQARTSARASNAECTASRAADEVSQAQISIVAAQLERTRLYAPFDGVVAEINGEQYEYVTPSPIGVATPPSVDLIDNSCFYIEAPIDEADAAKVKVGMNTRVTLDAFSGQVFPGRVRRIADYVIELAKQARTVDVEVDLSNAEDTTHLLAGYSADVEIITQRQEDTLRIPADALLEDDAVYLFDAGTGLIRKQPIETGLSNWNFIEVIAGLQAGDQIVTSIDREGLADGVTGIIDSNDQ
jgi:HlyD family secretion protein